MSRLIDVEALPTSIENMDLEVAEKIVERWMQNAPCDISWDAVRVLRDFYDEVKDAPTIVEFEGDINKVIVKGEEYHKQLTTTWLGDFCPYRCEHCGRYVDSKERYCPNCGRRASNYE